MSSEKNDFLTIIEDLINKDLEVGDLTLLTNKFRLSGYLINQKNNFYNFIVANKYSIQAVFGEECLKHYFSGQDERDIDSLNGHYINIRKYHLDYLIGGSVYNRNLSLNFVIYIEDFELENRRETDLEGKNIEEFIKKQNFADKIPTILNIFNKTNLKNKFTDESIPTFSAKNFINKTFIHYPLEESNTFVDGCLNDNKFFINYLIKKNEGVENQLIFYNQEKEAKIVEQQNLFDLKSYYETLPSVKEKIGNKFEAVPSNLDYNKIHNEKTGFNTFIPYDLKFDLNSIQLTKEKFLQKKIKRAPTISDAEILPQGIWDVIKEYSDVCANICYENVEKHKIYRKLKDYIK